MSERVPTSRLGRLARLAAVSARTSVSLVTKAAKGRDGAAEYTAEVLGNLRGLAAIARAFGGAHELHPGADADDVPAHAMFDDDIRDAALLDRIFAEQLRATGR